MEAFHVVATHPQLLPGIGDSNSQYDVTGQLQPGEHRQRHTQSASQVAERAGDVRRDDRSPSAGTGARKDS
jgi:hypothetical protein